MLPRQWPAVKLDVHRTSEWYYTKDKFDAMMRTLPIGPQVAPVNLDVYLEDSVDYFHRPVLRFLVEWLDARFPDPVHVHSNFRFSIPRGGRTNGVVVIERQACTRVMETPSGHAMLFGDFEEEHYVQGARQAIAHGQNAPNYAADNQKKNMACGTWLLQISLRSYEAVVDTTLFGTTISISSKLVQWAFDAVRLGCSGGLPYRRGGARGLQRRRDVGGVFPSRFREWLGRTFGAGAGHGSRADAATRLLRFACCPSQRARAGGPPRLKTLAWYKRE